MKHKNNLDLSAAAARVLQAKAQAKLAGVALLPSLDLSIDASRKGSIARNKSTRISNSFDVSLGASYEVDFCGKNRSRLISAQETSRAA